MMRLQVGHGCSSAYGLLHVIAGLPSCCWSPDLFTTELGFVPNIRRDEGNYRSTPMLVVIPRRHRTGTYMVDLHVDVVCLCLCTTFFTEMRKCGKVSCNVYIYYFFLSCYIYTTSTVLHVWMEVDSS